jgi:transposase
MANHLKVAKVFSIQALHAQGWSQRRIARELGIHRETVQRYLAGASKPATAPTGPEDSKPAKAPTGSESVGESSKPAEHRPKVGRPTGSRSCCEPFREVIEAKLDQGLSAQRIFQDLVDQHDFSAKYHSVRRFVASLKKSTPLPFRRIEVAPGEEAQIDFGKGATIVNPDGTRRRTHVLRIVLSHSRKAYSEAVYRQTTENLIRCLENAFWHFGGAPKTLVPDNLKAAVLKADWYDPDLNPKLRSFCEHYGTVLMPTKPRTPRHKGKVERGVDYVQENALKGMTFESLSAQNEHLLRWETTVADTRIHGTTRKQVLKVYREVEREALKPLPLERFPCFQEAERIVSSDGHVAVDRSYYSVPPEYLRRTVWVRWDSRLVRIFDQRMQPICAHATQPRGKFSTLPEHIASEKISPVERGAEWLLEKVSYIGPNTRKWSRGLVARRGVEAVRVLHGLLNLAKKHPSAVIEEACGTAASYEAYRLATIRKLMQRGGPRQEEFEFLAEHPLIRNLSDYGDVVRVNLRKEATTQ